MAYYDRIARQWHDISGFSGGAFKELVLNERLLAKLPAIDGRAILELGAGNGYFLPLVFRRFAGQTPGRVVVSDQSGTLLGIARNQFALRAAEYQLLDVAGRFPFAGGAFDLILASMLFNEVAADALTNALGECRRVLASGGLLLMTVLHPEFVDGLRERGMLKREPNGLLTMPGSGKLRLPVVIRSAAAYRSALSAAGFGFDEENVFAGSDVVNIRPGLRFAGSAPLALVFECRPLL